MVKILWDVNLLSCFLSDGCIYCYSYECVFVFDKSSFSEFYINWTLFKKKPHTYLSGKKVFKSCLFALENSLFLLQLCQSASCILKTKKTFH